MVRDKSLVTVATLSFRRLYLDVRPYNYLPDTETDFTVKRDQGKQIGLYSAHSRFAVANFGTRRPRNDQCNAVAVALTEGEWEHTQRGKRGP
jgi:hypothetical protein